MVGDRLKIGGRGYSRIHVYVLSLLSLDLWTNESETCSLWASFRGWSQVTLALAAGVAGRSVIHWRYVSLENDSGVLRQAQEKSFPQPSQSP